MIELYIRNHWKDRLPGVVCEIKMICGAGTFCTGNAFRLLESDIASIKISSYTVCCNYHIASPLIVKYFFLNPNFISHITQLYYITTICKCQYFYKISNIYLL